jgi:predicted 3-demethylubiquinone-9 3-methyltransferase (glyoxalase superfamily)
VKPKNVVCLWFNSDAHEAARFYAATFPNSAVTAVHLAPTDYPNGKAGDVLTVEFTVLGIPCLGLNGGPTYTHSEAFSFQIATDDQEETAGGAEAKRVFEAMMPMKKIDIAAITAARRR